ncbi:MAG: PilZ domain-containing protein [Myxococcota bacterium]|nr:PilZ domain-containing protein [Myxococcota bacterium]
MATLQDRKNQRFERRYPVTAKTKSGRILGFTLDISSTGLSFSAKQSMSTNEDIVLEIKVGRLPVVLKGKVRWCRRSKRANLSKPGYAVGLEIQERNPDYVALLEKVVRELDSHENKPKHKEDLHVSFETRWHFVMEYEKNIRNNTIFIPTKKVFEVGKPIYFTMHLLEVMRVVHTQGVVAYVVDEFNALAKPVGVGISITNYHFGGDALMREIVQQAGGHI